MTYSSFDPAAQNRVPWNFGAKVGPTRPFNQIQIRPIRFFLDHEERIRDRALFDLPIDSKLRGCDLIELKIGDLVSDPEIRIRATITQRLTGRPDQAEIAKDARESLLTWLECRGGSGSNFVFPSGSHSSSQRSVSCKTMGRGLNDLTPTRFVEPKFRSQTKLLAPSV